MRFSRFIALTHARSTTKAFAQRPCIISLGAFTTRILFTPLATSSHAAQAFKTCFCYRRPPHITPSKSILNFRSPPIITPSSLAFGSKLALQLLPHVPCGASSHTSTPATTRGVEIPFTLRCHHYKGGPHFLLCLNVRVICFLTRLRRAPFSPLQGSQIAFSGPHILGFRFSKLLQQRNKHVQPAVAAPDSTVPTKPAHFVISSVQPMGQALRTALMQHMHKDAEDILNGKGGNGCHGTYNVAWYKCTCPSPLSDDAHGIMKTMFADNRCACPCCSRPSLSTAPCCSFAVILTFSRHSSGASSCASQAYILTKSFCFSADFWHHGQWPALSASPQMLMRLPINFYLC